MSSTPTSCTCGLEPPNSFVKAADADNHHIGREITAHERLTGPLVAWGGAARLQYFDRGANLLVTHYRPGALVDGNAAEFSSDTHRQAGELLYALHDQPGTRVDADYERRATDRALEWLASDHRITPQIQAEVRRRSVQYSPCPVTLVPTHGDWQRRN